MSSTSECPNPSRFLESEAGRGMHSEDREHRSLSGGVMRLGQRRKRQTARKGSRKTSRC
jgi:hypothetical protein